MLARLASFALAFVIFSVALAFAVAVLNGILELFFVVKSLGALAYAFLKRCVLSCARHNGVALDAVPHSPKYCAAAL